MTKETAHELAALLRYKSELVTSTPELVCFLLVWSSDEFFEFFENWQVRCLNALASRGVIQKTDEMYYRNGNSFVEYQRIQEHIQCYLKD